MQLFAKFKKILRKGFRATLNFRGGIPIFFEPWVIKNGVNRYSRDLPHRHNNLVCWIINLLFDILLFSIAENFYSFLVFWLTLCLSKYGTTRKNTQRYYITKCLISYIKYLHKSLQQWVMQYLIWKMLSEKKIIKANYFFKKNVNQRNVIKKIWKFWNIKIYWNCETTLLGDLNVARKIV